LIFIFAGAVIVVRNIVVTCAGYWDTWKIAGRLSSVTAKPRKVKKPTAVQKTTVAKEKNPALKKIWMIRLQSPCPDGLSCFSSGCDAFKTG